LMIEVFEQHDRDRFEVIGVALNNADDAMRTRLVAAFDQFINVSDSSDLEAAAALQGRVDIAIDLMGHTAGARTELFAHRLAPIQASYLGQAGTLGADFIDYVIADPMVVPLDQQPFYAEKIIHVPTCYYPNSSRPVASVPTRGEVQLPDRGFVFTCFNNAWKISEEFFAMWLELLHAVDGSVLVVG